MSDRYPTPSRTALPLGPVLNLGLEPTLGTLPNLGLLYGLGQYGLLFAWNVAAGVAGGTYSRTGDATYNAIQPPFLLWDYTDGVSGGTFARTGEATYNAES